MLPKRILSVVSGGKDLRAQAYRFPGQARNRRWLKVMRGVGVI
jgi:hypothetical protein